MAPNRPLRIALFDVYGTTLAAVDEVIPVVVEAHALSGEVKRVHTWALSPDRRGQPTATALALTEHEILVVSPAAGGLVRIERTSSTVEIVPLDSDPYAMVVRSNVVWVWAEDRFDYDGVRGAERRPVVWEEPSEEDMARWRARVAGWEAYAPGAPPEEGIAIAAERPRPTAEDWKGIDDDYQDVIQPPTPMWRIDSNEVHRVPVGGVVIDLVSVDGHVVVVAQMPSDPLVKVVEPFGSLHYIRPGTVLVGDGSGGWQEVGQVETTDGSVVAEGGRVWLLGFCREADERRSPVREVDLGAGRISDPIPIDVEEPVTVIAGHVVDLVWSFRTEGSDDPIEEDRRPRRMVKLVPLEQGETRVLDVGRVQNEVVAEASTAWFRRLDDSTLVALDTRGATTREVAITFDCRPYAPAVEPPVGLDLAAFELEQLEALRSLLLGGWRGAGGEREPFIEGVSFETIELRGELPRDGGRGTVPL